MDEYISVTVFMSVFKAPVNINLLVSWNNYNTIIVLKAYVYKWAIAFWATVFFLLSFQGALYVFSLQVDKQRNLRANSPCLVSSKFRKESTVYVFLSSGLHFPFSYFYAKRPQPFFVTTLWRKKMLTISLCQCEL